MEINKRQLSKEAIQHGFVRDTYEKVVRLVEILKMMQHVSPFCEHLFLKGGTAINLVLFDMPRLSVDIDLDYDGQEEKELVMINRKNIEKELLLYMQEVGYQISDKSKSHYALDSYVFSYINAGGQKDNIKIDINYALRTHLLPPVKKRMYPSFGVEKIQILHPIEIFAGKTNALMQRGVPRDVYDYDQMIQADYFSSAEKMLLKKCAIFYKVISGNPEEPFDVKKINHLVQDDIKKNLIPVLHRKEFADLTIMKASIFNFYEEYLKPDQQEALFLSEFLEGRYRPELLFENKEILQRIQQHPMILWKLKQQIK